MTINYNLKEMKIKYVLTAMAIPAMFAACSQDEFLSEVNNSQNDLLGTPVKVDFVLNEDPQTRVDWGFTGGAEWNANDQFSLFWHGATANGTGMSKLYKGCSNAIYTKGDDGVFRTPSVTYVGSQIIVFPADKSHVKEQNIEVSIPAIQDGNISLGNRSVFVSDEIMLAQPVDEDSRDDDTYYAGYNEPFKAKVNPLSSNLALNLKFKMTDKINEVIVKKVTLKVENSANKFFATTGNLYKNSTGNHTAFKGTADVNEISVVMPEGTKVTTTNKETKAQIAFLPVTASLNADGDVYTILVETNYGVVTISKAALVTKTDGKIQTKDGAVELSETNKDDLLSFYVELGKTDEWSSTDEGYGKRIVRNVEVNMSEADIDNMVVENSEELIEAYRIYDVLGKTGAVNFKLNESVEGGKYFNLTKAAYEKIVANENVTLSFEGATEGIRLVNDANEFTEIPALSEALASQSNKTLVLGEGNWTLDVNNDGNYVKQGTLFNKLINEGTLTLTATTKTSSNVEIETEVVNDGTIEIAETLLLKAKLTQNAGASLNIPTTKTLTLQKGESQDINGTVTVNGRLIADGSSVVVNFVQGATVTVNGSLLQSNSGAINNAGSITLGENGAIIMEDNAISGSNGSILLNNRENQVSVKTNNGYIKLVWSESRFTPESTDAFNYLILQNNIDLSDVVANSGIDYFEIPEGKTIAVTYKATTSPQTFEKVFVKKNATLRVPVGSAITATNTENDGAIEVYGDYTPGNKTGNGVIYEFK